MKKVIAMLGVLLPVFAQAHGTADVSGGFMHGFAHAFYGLDHWLAMLAGGIWLSRLDQKKRTFALAAFALVFSLTMLSANFIPALSVDWGIIATAVVLCCTFMAFQRLYTNVAAALLMVAVGLFGVAHGVELNGGAWAMAGAVAAGLTVLMLSSMAFGFLRRATLRVVRI